MLKDEMNRNKRIVAYIMGEYQAGSQFELPSKVAQFVALLQGEIRIAEAWLKSCGKL